MAQDGLPSEVIQAFAQTPDHYLWIGTLRGCSDSMEKRSHCSTAKTLRP